MFEKTPVMGIQVVDWIPTTNAVSAKIRWTPGQWNSCDFDFIWQTETEIHKKEVREVSFQKLTTHFLLSTIFRLKIQVKSSWMK